MIISYDMETTGLNRTDDDILQLSIVDEHGNTLFNEMFKPTQKTEWPDASAVHGITPEKVRDLPTFDKWRSEIQSIFDNSSLLVGYNQLSFDDPFLTANGICVDSSKSVDVMLTFSEFYGETNTHPEGFNKTPYKWKKLSQAAEFFGYDWGVDHAHDSLADAKAAMFVYRNLVELQDYLNLKS